MQDVARALARCVLYVLLGVVCVGFAGLVYVVGGSFGALVGRISFALLNALIPRLGTENSLLALMVGGGLLGSGCGLLLLAKLWISQAQQSDDPMIRRLGDSLAELSRAVRRPR